MYNLYYYFWQALKLKRTFINLDKKVTKICIAYTHCLIILEYRTELRTKLQQILATATIGDKDGNTQKTEINKN